MWAVWLADPRGGLAGCSAGVVTEGTQATGVVQMRLILNATTLSVNTNETGYQYW